MQANPTTPMLESASDSRRACKLVLSGVAMAALGIFFGGIMVAEASTWFGLLLTVHSIAVLLFLTANAKPECADVEATTRPA